MAVYNINYRLSSIAPWPACGDDCLEAGRFFLDAEIPEFQGFNRKRIFVMGGSAGGHLALMTGLRLPPERVAGIISISGIADVEADFPIDPMRYKILLGHTPAKEDFAGISPATYLMPASPAILCTHEHHDNVVPIASAERFLEAVQRNGSAGEAYFMIKMKTDTLTESGFRTVSRTNFIRNSKTELQSFCSNTTEKRIPEAPEI